jgi:hypothetical protein
MLCEQCNAKLKAGISSCPSCGYSLLPKEPLADGSEKEISWETNISLLTNPMVWKQMAMVIFGACMGMAFILSFIFAVSGEYRDIPAILFISLIISLGLWLLFLLIALVFFGNRMRIRYTMDHNGVLWETVDKRARIANRMVIAAGILGGNLKAAGAGSIAASREKEFVHWKELSDAIYDKHRRMLKLRNRWRTVMLVVCLPDNYDQVVAITKKKIIPAKGASANKKKAKPLGMGLLRTLLVTLMVLPIFALTFYPFELNMFLPLLMFLFALATVWLISFFGWVVIGCAVILSLQIGWMSLFEMVFLDTYEIIVVFLSYAGLIYLIWFSLRAIRGKVRSVLVQR